MTKLDYLIISVIGLVLAMVFYFVFVDARNRRMAPPPYRVLRIDNCDYILLYGKFTHKADCTNQIHFQQRTIE